jgi:hypothetical protein
MRSVLQHSNGEKHTKTSAFLQLEAERRNFKTYASGYEIRATYQTG